MHSREGDGKRDSGEETRDKGLHTVNEQFSPLGGEEAAG